MPPYMQIKQFILNHPIKDSNNTNVLISIISESNAKRLEQKWVNINQAIDVTRALLTDAWWEAGFNNYDIITEKLMEERRAMTSLIYVLENYCEQKQTSPFELSIPKGALMDSVKASFQDIKELITENVVKEIGTLRKDLKGEGVDVRQIVEARLTQDSALIQEAINTIAWKVKTDVDNTNLEDINQKLLWCLSKKKIAEKLGGAAAAGVLGGMTDDLIEKLIATKYKVDFTNQRKYTITELTNRFGYKSQSNVMVAISLLLKAKLIKVYANKTYSL